MTDTETETPAIDTFSEQASVLFGETYHRRRPFLVINETLRPAPTVNTSKAGWKDTDGNIQTFESVSIVDRVGNREMRSAAIIIDLLNRTMVKNRHSSLGTDKQFIDYYMEKYSAQVTEGLQVWARRSALDISKKQPS